MKKKIPNFKSEAEEQAFWSRADSADYIDWAKARKRAFPNLKPSVKSISIRLPQALIEQYKILANKQDVPYQSLMKVHLAERLEKELRKGV